MRCRLGCTDWLFATAGIIIVACPTGRADEKQAPTAVNDPQFHAALLSVAKGYPHYGKTHAALNWAPTLCAPPSKPTFVHWSEANGDRTAHGGKVYYLFAKDAKDYLRTATDESTGRNSKHLPDDQNALQVIVKESWQPASVSGRGSTVTVNDTVHRDGKAFTAGERADLFIMMKFAKDRPGTDEGWIYGTVAPDGKTVTSSGRVQQCMSCHATAPHHRLFGLNYDAKKK